VDVFNEIVEFFVHRDDGTGAAVFDLEINDWSRPYTFLILMGHWDRTNYGSTPYTYDDTSPPTLLAAGATQVNPEPNLTIHMRPIIIDTVFVNGAQTRNVVVSGSRLTTLSPAPWSVKWTLDAASFTKLAMAEGKDPGITKLTDIVLSSSTSRGFFDIYTDIVSTFTSTTPGDWTLTTDLSAYTTTGNVGKSGYVNFNLNCVPFRTKTWSTKAADAVANGVRPWGDTITTNPSGLSATG
jgi:hypothetical protein